MGASCLQSDVARTDVHRGRRPVSIRLMATFGAGKSEPQMIILGLVIQQPDTIAGVNRRLADQFPSAHFAKGAANGNLRSLADKGYVHLIERGPPGEPTRDRFEATDEGRTHFLQWLHKSEVPMRIRDVMQFKLELVEREDLPIMLRVVRELEEAAITMCDIARARVLREQRSRRVRAQRFSGEDEYLRWRVQHIRSKDGANLWSMMSQRLEQVGDELEALIDDLSSEDAPS